MAQTLQVQAAMARGCALASRERLERCVERAQRAALEAAPERERVARDRRDGATPWWAGRETLI